MARGLDCPISRTRHLALLSPLLFYLFFLLMTIEDCRAAYLSTSANAALRHGLASHARRAIDLGAVELLVRVLRENAAESRHEQIANKKKRIEETCLLKHQPLAKKRPWP
jgi:hypothetical protein